MSGITVKNFDSPDEVRTPDKTRSDVVDLGTTKAARMTLQPGWSWDQCIKPLVGTDTCQARHVGVILSGSLHLTHTDGNEADLVPGDAYVIEPGHDAWVTGEEPVVGYEFEPTTAGSFGQGGS